MWVGSVTRTWDGDRDGAGAALNLPADQIHMRAACTSAPGQPRARGGVRYGRARRWMGGRDGVLKRDGRFGDGSWCALWGPL